MNFKVDGKKPRLVLFSTVVSEALLKGQFRQGIGREETIHSLKGLKPSSLMFQGTVCSTLVFCSLVPCCQILILSASCLMLQPPDYCLYHPSPLMASTYSHELWYGIFYSFIIPLLLALQCLLTALRVKLGVFQALQDLPSAPSLVSVYTFFPLCSQCSSIDLFVLPHTYLAYFQLQTFVLAIHSTRNVHSQVVVVSVLLYAGLSVMLPSQISLTTLSKVESTPNRSLLLVSLNMHQIGCQNALSSIKCLLGSRH